jgi:hypothetical protein
LKQVNDNDEQSRGSRTNEEEEEEDYQQAIFRNKVERKYKRDN